jgi:hypothetical protein
MSTSRHVAAIGAALALAATPAPQSNQVPGTDVSLGALDVGTDVAYWGRTGNFPSGTAGFSISTTACNLGIVDVDWHAPMDEEHPFIAFLFAREADGRMEQISSRSYVKHGFFALSNSQCTPCPAGSDGSYLAIGCSDTYSTGNNGDRNYLGPPDEIDPWLGTWNAQCSYFDRGDPPVAPPNDCNGIDSLSGSMISAFNAVKNRVIVRDADLTTPGAVYYYQGYYVIRTEPEANRANNIAHREFRPSWNGSLWFMDTSSFSNPHRTGSVLSSWTGATLDSNTNGADDGRVFVAVKVTGPVAGLYHYEYALHNRDNARGVSGFRLPICRQVPVSNVRFHDVDSNAANEWSTTQTKGELVFWTVDNPLQWNSIFNFSFDTTAWPVSGASKLEQFDPGPGLAAFDVDTLVPMGCPPVANTGKFSKKP